MFPLFQCLILSNPPNSLYPIPSKEALPLLLPKLKDGNFHKQRECGGGPTLEFAPLHILKKISICRG